MLITRRVVPEDICRVGPRLTRPLRCCLAHNSTPSSPSASVMPSILSRFRRRQPTPEPPLQDTPPLQQEPSAQQLPIARKILENPSSFLEAEAQDALPLGLTPSTRLPSGGSGNARSRPRPTDLSSEPLPGSSVDISPRTQSRLAISRISKIAAGGEWSTFGRKRKQRVADVVDLSEPTSPPDNPKSTPRSPSPTRDIKHLSADSSLSTFSLSRLTNPSRPSFGARERHTSPGTRSPRQSHDIRLSSKPSSPTNTMTSKWHPRTPQTPSSHTAPAAAHATSSVSILTTPVNRELANDSPHTFGHPTPPDKPVAYPSPPPPLPPLEHPELAIALSSRTQSASTGQPPLSAFRDRSNTLPTNRRTPRKDDLFASLSFKLGRSARDRSSLPQTKQVAMAEQRLPDSPERRRRARTVSADTRQRRTSADWSSHQASVGVNSHANQAWPAEVSREILRLSLRSAQNTPGPDTLPGSSEIRKARTRGRSADPDRRPNQGAMSPSFLPFPHPSRPNSPPPPRASATPAGAHKPISWTPQYHLTCESRSDAREVIFPRPHSLQFDLGNRRGSQQPGRFTMTEVKRSLSAIESRNRINEASGAKYNSSLGLSDPAQTLSQATQVSPLLLPSFALTPSRSLLSSHVSPTNPPMASSVQEEPSTPTPAPRHLSDKSRGKRKAEDNIDLTPPEQKKEGQRATFLLPSETRSECTWLRLRPLYQPCLKLKQRSASLKLLACSIVVPPQARSLVSNLSFHYPRAIATVVCARDAQVRKSQSQIHVSLQQYWRSHCSTSHTFACCIHSFPSVSDSQHDQKARTTSIHVPSFDPYKRNRITTCSIYQQVDQVPYARSPQASKEVQ